MFDYIQKFNSLPREIREKVSTSTTVEKIEEMELKFDVNLAPLIMKVMVGDVKVDELKDHLIQEMSYGEERAKELKEELISNIFVKAADHLGLKKGGEEQGESKEQESEEQTQGVEEGDLTFNPEEREVQGLADKIEDYEELDPLRYQIEKKADKIVKEVDINFSSEFLFSRLKIIIITYLKSIRNQTNTRQALAKEVSSGGLGLEDAEIDNILNAAKREKMDLEEKPYFHPSDVQYTSDYGGDLTTYKASPSREQGKGRKQQSQEKDISRSQPDKKIKGQQSSLSEEREQEQEEQEKQPQKGRSSLDRDKKRVLMQEDKEGSPGIDLERIGGERDIDYDLKSVLEQKYKQGRTEDQKKKEEVSTEPTKGESLKEQKQEPEKGERDKEQEKKKGLFGRMFSGADKAPQEQEKDKSKEQKAEEKKIEVKKEAEEVKKQERIKEKKKREEKQKEQTFIKQRSEQEQDKGKKRVEDIKPAPKSMSPTDELRYMDVVTFRRLGEDSNDRIEKIKKKIDLLGKESLGKMFEGIKAWRQSPVNKMYINMGQQSMNQGKDIKTIIKERKSNDQDYLTETEFNAVLELNKKLRFY